MTIKKPIQQNVQLTLLLLAASLFPSVAFTQSVRDDIGYTALLQQLGSSTPDGSGIEVGVIEPPLSLSKSNPLLIGWTPRTNWADTDLSGKEITGFDDQYNKNSRTDHATRVAQYLFSNNVSSAPGITKANFYNLDNYIKSHLIPRANYFAQNPIAYQTGLTQFNLCKLISTSPSNCKNSAVVFENRVNNFSAISSFGSVNTRLLRQYDWATANEDALNIISAGNFSRSPAIYSSSFNGIYVGITAGTSGKFAAPVNNLYNGFRQRPDVVAPEVHTSNGTPIVSSVVASLAQAAKNPNLSKKGQTNSFADIQNAERSEVIKAIVMAGADRVTANTRKNAYIRNEQREIILDEEGKSLKQAADIKDYRADDKVSTDNGLDTRYGAGQVNIFNSYQILAAGEQNSREDGGDETVSLFGFDYDEAFGNWTGDEHPNSVASYLLPILEADADIYATLDWNLDVYGGGSLFINALLYDLDLWLYEIGGDFEELVTSSTSDNANTETIWQSLKKGRQYELRITSEKNVTALLWDYGFAWRVEQEDTSLTLDSLQAANPPTASSISSSPVPSPGALWLMLSAIALLVSRKIFT